MIPMIAAMTGYGAFVVYVGMRLGWWANASRIALDFSMGPANRFERAALLTALVIGPAFAVFTFTESL